MVTYYRGQTLVITHDVVEVWWPAHRRYAVGELNEVYVVRGAVATGLERQPVGAFAILSAGVVLVAAAVALVRPYPVPAVVLGVLAVTLLASVGGLGRRSASGSWELRAIYRGADVCLYSSADSLVFGQVKRALVRALESYGP